MKNFLLFIITVFVTTNLTAQSKKMIDQTGGSRYYGEYYKEVISENTLPKTIQFNSKEYLKKILPTLIDSITFSHGQIIDLKKKFKAEPKVFELERIIPKYELDYNLHNTSIGIKTYNLEISLDEHGQILYTNWPKKRLQINNFKSFSEIEAFGLKYSEQKQISFNTHEIDLVYKEELDQLYWIMKILTKSENGRKEFHVIEFPWNSLNISEEYTAYSQSVY